jgi:uroporphyrinogen-III synthase
VELTRRGAAVDVVEAYRTAIPDNVRADAHQALVRKPDWITFTSSSTVNHFLEAAGTEALEGVKIASIGPVTSGTLKEHGWQVDVEAEPHTIPGLIDAIVGAV